MHWKTRKLVFVRSYLADLEKKRKQQLSDNVKLVGDMPKHLLCEPQEKDRLFQMKTVEELAKMQEERLEAVSVIEALQQSDGEDEKDGWTPFNPRSKL